MTDRASNTSQDDTQEGRTTGPPSRTSSRGEGISRSGTPTLPAFAPRRLSLREIYSGPGLTPIRSPSPTPSNGTVGEAGASLDMLGRSLTPRPFDIVREDDSQAGSEAGDDTGATEDRTPETLMDLARQAARSQVTIQETVDLSDESGDVSGLRAAEAPPEPFEAFMRRLMASSAPPVPSQLPTTRPQPGIGMLMMRRRRDVLSTRPPLAPTGNPRRSEPSATTSIPGSVPHGIVITGTHADGRIVIQRRPGPEAERLERLDEDGVPTGTIVRAEDAELFETMGGEESDEEQSVLERILGALVDAAQLEDDAVVRGDSRLAASFPTIQVDEGAEIMGISDCPICLQPIEGEVMLLPCWCVGHVDCMKEAIKHNVRCPMHKIDVRDHLAEGGHGTHTSESDDDGTDADTEDNTDEMFGVRERPRPIGQLRPEGMPIAGIGRPSALSHRPRHSGLRLVEVDSAVGTQMGRQSERTANVENVEPDSTSGEARPASETTGMAASGGNPQLSAHEQIHMELRRMSMEVMDLLATLRMQARTVEGRTQARPGERGRMGDRPNPRGGGQGREHAD